MIEKAQSPGTVVRAEHESVGAYLERKFNSEELQHVLFPAFNQWQFALDALAETALACRDLRSSVTFAFWSRHTPMADTGWTSSHRLAQVFQSRTLDGRYEEGLRAAGFRDPAFASPPIRKWKPQAPLPPVVGLDRSSVRKLSYRGSPVGRAILQVRPEPMTPTAEDHKWPRRWVERSVRSYAFVYDQVSHLIKNQKISSLITYNGRFLHDRAAVAAARDLGVGVIYYDLGGLDTGFDLTIDETHDWSALQDRMKAMYQRWPEEERNQVGAQWFSDRRDHRDPWNAHFIDGQRQGEQIELPTGDCTVVYFSSSSDEIAELDVDWKEYFGNQHEAVKLVSDFCRRTPGYRLVVRTHPHKRHKPERDVEEWYQLVHEIKPDLHIDAHSPVDSYELMRQADLVVTYGSTTGVEAAFAGKPVIVLGPSAYDELGCAVRPRTREELEIAMMKRSTQIPERAIPYGLMMKRRGFALQHITRSADGSHVLSGVPLVEPRMSVRHGSHMLARWRRRYLNRR